MIPNQDTMATSVESSRAPQNAGLNKLLVGLAVGLGIAGFFYFDLGHYLSLDGLKSNRDHLLASRKPTTQRRWPSLWSPTARSSGCRCQAGRS